jgi:hypothetical protein
MRTAFALAGATCLIAASAATGSSLGPGGRTTRIRGGCGATQLYRGALPAWTAPAFRDSSPGPPAWPHALSFHSTVAAILFAHPLRAGKPTNPANKVLWIMEFPAASSPGEIYPSYVNVPTAGCWRLVLHWAGHTDQIDLRYIR